MAMSSALGGGMWLIKNTLATSKGKNKEPVKKGIQFSVTAKDCISQVPTDLTKPEEKTKLAASTLPINSVNLRPSM